MSTATGRESDKFMLRMPDGMRDRIRHAAESHGRSMNAEIVATLEKAYPVGTPLENLMSLFARVARQVEQMPSGPARDEINEILNSYTAAFKQEANRMIGDLESIKSEVQEQVTAEMKPPGKKDN